MIIEINDHTTIRQIQGQFSTKYPYLNLVFFQPGERMHPANVDEPVRNIKKTHISALLEIKPWNTIADVEKEFQFRFGLKVQVLQNSHNHWIPPAGADTLSLEEQNETGSKAADHIIHPEYGTRIEDNEF